MTGVGKCSLGRQRSISGPVASLVVMKQAAAEKRPARARLTSRAEIARRVNEARWSNPVGYVTARDGGDWLKEAREARCLSQRGLGRAARVDGHLISELEGIAGRLTAVDKAERIAVVLEVPLESLFTDEAPHVRIGERRRTRIPVSRGTPARNEAAALQRFCEERGLWNGRRTAKELLVDEKMVSHWVDRGLLTVAEVYFAAPFKANLFWPADVKQLARELWKSKDHRIHRNPDFVYRWAIARGWSEQDADRLAGKCRRRQQRYAAFRTGHYPAEANHARWREMANKLRAEHPDRSENSRLGEVMLSDWQASPDAWPRDRYPASKSDAQDIDGDVFDAAVKRVRQGIKYLQNREISS